MEGNINVTRIQTKYEDKTKIITNLITFLGQYCKLLLPRGISK